MEKIVTSNKEKNYNLISILGKQKSGRHSLLKQLQIYYGNITNNNFFEISDSNINHFFKVLPIVISEDPQRIDNIKIYSQSFLYVFDYSYLKELGLDLIEKVLLKDNILQSFSSELNMIVQIILDSGLRSFGIILNKVDDLSEDLKTDIEKAKKSISFISNFLNEVKNVIKNHLKIECILEEQLNICFSIASVSEEIGIKEIYCKFDNFEIFSIHDMLIKLSNDNDYKKNSTSDFYPTFIINDRYSETQCILNKEKEELLVFTGKAINSNIEVNSTLVTYDDKMQEIKIKYLGNYLQASVQLNDQTNFEFPYINNNEFTTIKHEVEMIENVDGSDICNSLATTINRGSLLVLKKDYSSIMENKIFVNSDTIEVEMRVVFDSSEIISAGKELLLSFNGVIMKATVMKLLESYDLTLDNGNLIQSNVVDKPRVIKENSFVRCVLKCSELIKDRTKFSVNRQLSYFYSVTYPNMTNSSNLYGKILRYKAK